MRLFAGTEFDVPPRCDRCNRLESECDCPPLVPETPRVPPEKQLAKIRTERRKRGKVVTTINGLDRQDLPELLVKLKNKCGAGGTIKELTIEIQGEHADRVASLLEDEGYRVKK